MRRSAITVISVTVIALGMVATVATATGNDHAEGVQGGATLIAPRLPSVGSQCSGGDWTYIQGSYLFTGTLHVSADGSPHAFALLDGKQMRFTMTFLGGSAGTGVMKGNVVIRDTSVSPAVAIAKGPLIAATGGGVPAFVGASWSATLSFPSGSSAPPGAKAFLYGQMSLGMTPGGGQLSISIGGGTTGKSAYWDGAVC
jgi:hypothetical protein